MHKHIYIYTHRIHQHILFFCCCTQDLQALTLGGRRRELNVGYAAPGNLRPKPQEALKESPQGHGQDFGRQGPKKTKSLHLRPTQTLDGHASVQGPIVVPRALRLGVQVHFGRVGRPHHSTEWRGPGRGSFLPSRGQYIYICVKVYMHPIAIRGGLIFPVGCFQWMCPPEA